MKAVLIGSTGLVGQEILRCLINEKKISFIKSFSRRATELQSTKLSQRLVDFDEIQNWNHELDADMAFSCLGTTRAQAGGLEKQYVVDYRYQAEFAKFCREFGVSTFVLISSVGADSRSKVPYLKMKGELDEYVQTLGFSRLKILRPGPLVGARHHRRYAEEMMLPFNRWLSKLPGLADLEPVSSLRVAECAVAHAMGQGGPMIVTATEIRKWTTDGHPSSKT